MRFAAPAVSKGVRPAVGIVFVLPLPSPQRLEGVFALTHLPAVVIEFEFTRISFGLPIPMTILQVVK